MQLFELLGAANEGSKSRLAQVAFWNDRFLAISIVNKLITLLVSFEEKIKTLIKKVY